MGGRGWSRGLLGNKVELSGKKWVVGRRGRSTPAENEEWRERERVRNQGY